MVLSPGEQHMISHDRLAELDTFRLDEDTPDDTYIRLPARDVRDLVSLISVVKAAVALRDLVALVHGRAVSPSPELWAAIKRFDAERSDHEENDE